MEASADQADGEGVPELRLPWFRGPTDTQPFTLSKMLMSDDPNASPFNCTAAFPWAANSIEILWDGVVTDEKVIADWNTMVSEFSGALAVGTTGKFHVFPKHGTGRPFTFKLPDESWEVRCISWTLRPEAPTDPLLVVAAFSVIIVVHVKRREVIGKLRGHGGPITSIAVQPLHPYLFCTTSKDFSTRIYDLTLSPIQVPNNPHWPPGKSPSLAGPAHGLHMTEPEGQGVGRCVVVLVGGLAGGHRGAVLYAAFHRSAPLIATCGMDRAVKIWRIPPYKPDILSREDKPLFSTDYIHKARVLSINWLSDDILISHCAPALMRKTYKDEIYEENGTVVIWQWLGFNRFFPPGKLPSKVMRGCASDYRNSESFKILSAYHLPMGALNLTVHSSPTHDPIILVPIGKLIRIFNTTHFKPREPPSFPFTEEDDMIASAKRMRLSDDRDRDASNPAEGSSRARDGIQDDPNGDDEREDESNDVDYGKDDDDYVARPSGLAELFTAIDGWNVDLSRVPEPRRETLPDITACEVAAGGRAILGVGAKGTLYVWRLVE
ncbi:WD40 repeat-like protein [Laetiporus sulphureus 93-53]|uniref:WD40 repeat-like protein n=1 Tax=Laetiporus sulphureus 93-53 TaxID=1314785 RepID=A0A165CDV5_9APHY|nr:WD40 repeat-like protein [Laetiporus sulphureus 93-53]KZT02634.1 WD40 repeat-like protein [Laetiporus sulphureus 93-53]